MALNLDKGKKRERKIKDISPSLVFTEALAGDNF